MDALAALRLQIAWGADEALDDLPLDRTRPVAAAARRPQVARAAADPGVAAAPPVRAEVVAPVVAPARVVPVPAGAAALATPVVQAQAAAAAAGTREALREALAGFAPCPLRDTAGHLVFFDGNPEAGVVLVGEVPGAEEDRAGTPFAGPAGQLLDRMLGSVGLGRTTVAMTMLVPWRPPGGRPPTDGEVAMCLPFLQRHLVLLRPRVLVPLGALATRAVTGNSLGIRRLRGRVAEAAVPGLEGTAVVLPMLPPAHLLRTPGAKREAWADLLQLRTLLDGVTKT
ncbi:MAG: uracil-DNA glycosylase [Janthinobacterium lividum]